EESGIAQESVSPRNSSAECPRQAMPARVSGVAMPEPTLLTFLPAEPLVALGTLLHQLRPREDDAAS
ncbi:hypothetical protein AK812_SmicGene46537, partial [Symbiodinium microadriaticum]